MFGTAVDCAKVRIRRRKWFPLQPRSITMAPRGHIHFHPESDGYCEDFAAAPLARQAHFIHEMVHVWQAQKHGEWYLLLNRMPWASYEYSLKPGLRLERYGIEQQAEIVKHAFILMRGGKIAGAPDLERYRTIVPFLPPPKRKSTRAA